MPQFTAIVTVTLFSPNGKKLGDEEQSVTINLTVGLAMTGEEAEEYMREQLNELCSAAVHGMRESAV